MTYCRQGGVRPYRTKLEDVQNEQTCLLLYNLDESDTSTYDTVVDIDNVFKNTKKRNEVRVQVIFFNFIKYIFLWEDNEKNVLNLWCMQIQTETDEGVGKVKKDQK